MIVTFRNPIWLGFTGSRSGRGGGTLQSLFRQFYHSASSRSMSNQIRRVCLVGSIDAGGGDAALNKLLRGATGTLA